MLRRSRLLIDRQGQLLWKEFNYFSGYSIPNFDKMVGNPVVRYVSFAGSLSSSFVSPTIM